MTTWLKALFNSLKWVTNLPKQKLVTFLFSVVVALLGIQNYYLREDNIKYRGRADYLSDRMDTLRGIYEKRIQECESARVEDISTSNRQAREEIKELQDRFYKEYEEVKKLVRK